MSSKSTPKKVTDEFSALNSIWDEIGYTSEEKEEGIRKIHSEIERVRAEFISKTLEQCQKLTNETEQIRSNHISMLKAIDGSHQEINAVLENGKTGTIKEKYECVKNKFKEFSIIYKKKYNEFDLLQKEIDICFNSLGITDKNEKGEFFEIGDKDLTSQRLRRYEKKINQLSEEVDSRSTKFEEIKNNILTISSNIQEPLPSEIEALLNNNVYSDDVLEKLNDYLEDIEEIFNTRKRYISEMAVEISRLWNLLNVSEAERRQFLSSHNALSQQNVQACIDEAERLTEIRNSKLPELIKRLRHELIEVCKSLGYSSKQRHEIIEKCQNTHPMATELIEEEESDDEITDETNDSKTNEINNEQLNQNDENTRNEDETTKFDFSKLDFGTQLTIFNNYNDNLVHLQKVQLIAQPIIDLINQRNQIIDEYNELMKKPKPSDNEFVEETPEMVKVKRFDQLNGKGIKLKNQRVRLVGPKDKHHAEKVTRRHKMVLPRVEKKLYILLVQFRNEQNGEDFFWEGKPAIDELKHVNVTQSEIDQNREYLQKKKRVSIQPIDDDEIQDDKKIKRRKSLNVVSQNKVKKEPSPMKSRQMRRSELPKKMKPLTE